MGNFENVLKSLRLSNKLTQDELSKKLKISRSTIGMYENGSRQPDFETLELIADFFNVDIDFLLGRSNKTTYIPSQPTPLSTDDVQSLVTKHYGPAAEGMLLYSQLDIEDRSEIKGEMRQMLKAAKYTTKPFTREDLHKALDQEHIQERQREA